MDNLRTDGRGCEDFRSMEVETDMVSTSTGSARLRLANTDVLVGVKAEIGEPLPNHPDRGRIEFFIDCSANATPEFEGRGGEELANEISSTLAAAFDNPGALDLKKLCILNQQQCWILYVEILLLEVGGNLFDAVSIAVKSALFNTRIPNVVVSTGEKGELELEISDDPYDCKRLNVTGIPILITLTKIGHCHAVDVSMEEEACALARLIMGVTEAGNITTIKKSGGGSLDPESIYDMMESGRRVGKKINSTLMAKLREEEELGGDHHTVGFLK